MISAIVINHNGEDHLERCLASLRGQTVALETLVVDNASSDSSVAMVGARFPEVRLLVLDTNRGFGVANNLAAAEARGELLLLLNADAWLEQTAVELLERRLRSRRRNALVAPTLTYPDGALQFVWSPARSVLGEALQKLRNPFEALGIVHGRAARGVSRVAGRLWFTAACVLLRREAFQSVGGFDERFFMYFEDVDLCLRLEAAGWRLAHEPLAVARHQGGLARRGCADEAYRRAQLLFYAKHRPAWELCLIERRLARRFGADAVKRWQREGVVGE